MQLLCALVECTCVESFRASLISLKHVEFFSLKVKGGKPRSVIYNPIMNKAQSIQA